MAVALGQGAEGKWAEKLVEEGGPCYFAMKSNDLEEGEAG